MSRILIVGDIHGDHKSVTTAAGLCLTNKCYGIIIAGDTGYRFSDEFTEAVYDSPVPVGFIRGNHDDTDWLRQHSGDSQSDLWGPHAVKVMENGWWYPDLSTMEIGGKVFGFQGGGFSIDYKHREIGRSMWADEMPTDASELVLELGTVKADYLITHDVPDRFWSQLSYMFPPLQDRYANTMAIESRRLADTAYEFFGHPKKVIHGHYHYAHETKDMIGLHANERQGWACIYDGGTDTFEILDMHKAMDELLTKDWYTPPSW